ncbi:MAG: GntR family transcriptional regulator [Eubacteriales bacterium]|nr:GntR family transcriptional regulator [Eubacteriales bacterium]
MLDNDTGIPLYLQIYDKLKLKITGGLWPEGSLIPAETSLMKQYGVGRETVRRAVLRLVNEGYLFRQQGKGTFVCRKRPEDGLEQIVSFTAEMLARGYKPGTKVLANRRQKPDPNTANRLNCSPAEDIYYFKRLRTANELLVAVEESWLCIDILGPLDQEKLAGSFYDYLVYDKGIKPGRIVQEISSDVADAETAELLEVAPGHPILQLSRLMYTSEGRPFFWMVFRYRGDIYSIKTKLDLS